MKIDRYKTHDIEVATAESAEGAIEYLSESQPDIIFMDHEMPGMDGLEAVSTIKDNPATATIPIMMYTAQQGELYVGQARALGAIGVLPKQLEPVEVSKVLESLRIIGEDAEAREKRDRAEPAVRKSSRGVLQTGFGLWRRKSSLKARLAARVYPATYSSRLSLCLVCSQ